MSEQKTIFEGLYQIDWSQATAYDPAFPYEIPHAVRDLLSDDEFTRDDAQTFLFEDVLSYYDVHKDAVTPTIFHFILEVLVLAETPVPDKLGLIGGLILSLDQSHMSFYSQSRAKAVYHLLEPYLPQFVALLNAPDPDLRMQAIVLLRRFEGSAQALIFYFMQRFEEETNLLTRMMYLRSVGVLLANEPMPPETAETQTLLLPLFWDIAQTHASGKVRGIAAQIGIQVAQQTLLPIPSFAVPLLLDSFVLVGWDENMYGHWQFYEKQRILAQIKRLPQAHTLVSELLKYQYLETQDVRLLNEALVGMTQTVTDSIFDRIGDVIGAALKSLLDG